MPLNVEMVYSQNVSVLKEIGVAKSISGGKFATGSRINVGLLTAHVQTLSSQKSPKMVLCARNDRIFIRKRVHWIQIWRQILNRK